MQFNCLDKWDERESYLVMKVIIVKEMMTCDVSPVAMFDYVMGLFRVELEKKSFWVWFIYSLEGYVLGCIYFFLEKSAFLKHPSDH